VLQLTRLKQLTRLATLWSGPAPAVPDHILLESGAALLLESGDYLLLEAD
jgi:hypothetical protein